MQCVIIPCDLVTNVYALEKKNSNYGITGT